jgi:hypothetical protein
MSLRPSCRWSWTLDSGPPCRTISMIDAGCESVAGRLRAFTSHEISGFSSSMSLILVASAASSIAAASSAMWFSSSTSKAS